MAQASAGVKRAGPRFDEIVEASATVFSEQGYQATSIQDVADAVGLLKGSLYYYIDTKEDLLFAVLDNYHQQTKARLNELQALDVPVLEKLRRFIEADTAHAATHVRESRLFYTEWRNIEEGRRAHILRERDRHQRFVEDCIRSGQAEGTVRSSVDPKLAASGILGMVNSVYQWYRAGGRLSVEQIGEAFADILIGGITDHGSAKRLTGRPKTK